MKKIILPVLIIIFSITVASIVWNHNKSEAQSGQPQISQDNVVFNKYKDQIKGENINWAQGDAQPDPAVTDGYYIVVDKDGKVVNANRDDEKRSPASLTKLVTAMVVLDFASLSDVYKVAKDATNLEPTIMHLGIGEKLSVGELLQAMLMMSANDAAETLGEQTAEKIGGSEKLFIDLMNEKVRKLGLTNTHFVNTMGYDDPQQFSTARELAIISQYALTQYPEIAKIVATKEATIDENGEHKYYELPNWNSLLDVYPGVDGIKIGHTENAGHNTIVTSTREGERFMVVMLGAPDRRARDFWTADLLNFAFTQRGIKPFKVYLFMLQKRSEDWSLQLLRQKKKMPLYEQLQDGE